MNARAGLAVERRGDFPKSAWNAGLRSQPAPPTLLETLDHLPSDPRGETWILEEDRLRIVPWGEALRFRRAWGEAAPDKRPR